MVPRRKGNSCTHEEYLVALGKVPCGSQESASCTHEEIRYSFGEGTSLCQGQYPMVPMRNTLWFREYFLLSSKRCYFAPLDSIMGVSRAKLRQAHDPLYFSSDLGSHFITYVLRSKRENWMHLMDVKSIKSITSVEEEFRS